MWVSLLMGVSVGGAEDASVSVQISGLVQGNVLRQGVSLCWPLRGGLR